MSRKRLLACAVVLLVVATGVTLLMRPAARQAPEVTVANCQCVRLGMTLTEVEGLLGPGRHVGQRQYPPQTAELRHPWWSIGDSTLPGEEYLWWGKRVDASLTLDAEGRVVFAFFVTDRDDLNHGAP